MKQNLTKNLKTAKIAGISILIIIILWLLISQPIQTTWKLRLLIIILGGAYIMSKIQQQKSQKIKKTVEKEITSHELLQKLGRTNIHFPIKAYKGKNTQQIKSLNEYEEKYLYGYTGLFFQNRGTNREYIVDTNNIQYRIKKRTGAELGYEQIDIAHIKFESLEKDKD